MFHYFLSGDYDQPQTGRMRLKRPSVTITSPGSPGTTRLRPHSPQTCGKLKVNAFEFEH